MNPRMITVARESRGMTQIQLATRAEIPQGTLSKVENGLADLPAGRLQAIAAVLEYPVELFDWPDPVYGFGSSSFHHRKQQSLGQTTLKKIQANLNLLIGRLRRLTEGVEITAPFRFPALDIEDHDSPEQIARMVRAAWMLPMGPVQNVVGVIEGAGGLVLRRDLGSPRITALSINPPGGQPTFVMNRGLPTDRERFTLAHEAGHIIMHEIPRDDAEREADRFAAEFLMPSAEIRPALANIDLAKAATLKRHWKTAMSALIRRARDLDVITEQRYTSLMVQMSQRGYSKKEPVDLPAEEPTVVDTIIRIHIDQHGYTADQLASVACMRTQEFVSEFIPPGRRGLRVVR